MEQADLGLGRQLTDFIQENGAAMGPFEAPAFLGATRRTFSITSRRPKSAPMMFDPEISRS
jgi:hypothetical protein